MFGIGLIPGPRGTYGSAVALALVVLIDGVHGSDGWPMGLAALGCVVLGSAVTLLCSGRSHGRMAEGSTAEYGRPAPLRIPLGHSKDCDPSWVVSDEVAGQGLALALARLAPGGGWLAALAAFAAFRALDVLKPWPIRALERIPGGAGVLLDDIAAGAVAGAVVAVGTAILV